MKQTTNKVLSVLLSVVLLISVLTPTTIVSFGAGASIDITSEDGTPITTRQTIREYSTVQLAYAVPGGLPAGATVVWESNLPLLAGVDETGKVKGYDYSKTAIIQLWLDENVRILPLVGDAMADGIMNELKKQPVDLDNMNNDLIVAIVRGIAGDTLADSLKKALDNMNVEITATLYDADGQELASDTVEFVVEKHLFADAIPTGAHITNRKVVPTTVAVGTSVQLRGAITPVRLKHGLKWSIALGGRNRATVTADGLVTFTAPGEVTVRVASAQDLAVTSSITFQVKAQEDLPVESFDVVGTMDVKEGATTQLAVANVQPAGAYAGNVVWSTADPSIALVDQSGLVTGLDGGNGYLEYSKTTGITATIGKVSKTVNVKVSRAGLNGDISAVNIEGADALAVGSSAQYKAVVTPARLNENKSVLREWGLVNRETGEVVWASADAPAKNTFVSVDAAGSVQALASGQVTLAARASYNGKNIETRKDITIGKAITDFQITGKTEVTAGKTIQLSISNIMPQDYDQAILDTAVWTIGDPSLAHVSQTGLVTGLDGKDGTLLHPKTTTVTVTIGGISKSVEIKVKKALIQTYTGGSILGPDYIIKDFPVTYSAMHTPVNVSISRQYWGVSKETPEGGEAAPWDSGIYMGSDNLLNKFKGNMKNSIAEVQAPVDGSASTGKLVGLQAGKTTIYTYMANLLTTYQDLKKEVTVVEIEPESITLTPPTKKEYVEGNTELDLTGMEVKLTYNRNDIARYYGEEIANAYTEEELTVPVTDYTVSEVNNNLLDQKQYILVTVNRAGKNYNAVFEITVKSKEVTGIELEAPQYEYREGDTELNLTGLKVKANYANAEPEYVTSYVVNEADFDPTLLDVEQQITVTYTHAGRSASASFPVIVYGVPVVSVDTNAYDGAWTAKDIRFTLSATHPLEGVQYYYKTDSNPNPVLMQDNSLIVNTNTEDTYYFKAVNSKGIESAFTEGYTVKRDDVTPSFNLQPTETKITNQSYKVNLTDLTIGASGVQSVTLNGADITATPDGFLVEENSDYTVVLTAKNGLSCTKTLTVSNIDKEAPTVLSVSIANKEDGAFARFLDKITFGLFFNQKVEVTITAEDKGVAGLDRIEYRFLDENGQPLKETWETYSDAHKPTQDVNFKGYVEARAVDKATNVSDVLRSDGYVIDTVNPTDVAVTASYQDAPYTAGTWVAGDVQITLNSTAFSDIYEYQYRMDGGAWQSLEGNTFTATEIGAHTYEFKAISYSTLESALSKVEVKIDRQTPVIRVDFEGTFGKWTGDGVKFSLRTEEPSLSGVDYYYDNGNGWTLITTGATIEINENVNATYRFKAVNHAGTESYPSDSYKVMNDTELPNILLTPQVTEATTEPYAVGVEVTTGASGLKSLLLNGVDITGQTSVTVSKNGTYVFTALGQNGKIYSKTLEVQNFYTPVLEITAIDFGAPARVLPNEFGSYYAAEPQITITANSTGAAPIEKIEYRLLDSSGKELAPWAEYQSNEKPTVAAPFTGYVEARVYDANGNVSLPSRSKGITVDTALPTVPTVTTVHNGKAYDGSWVAGDVTFSLSSTAYSGIFAYFYQMDGGEWLPMTDNTLQVHSDGVHRYAFKAVSNATLESEIAGAEVQIENAAPALQVGIEGTIGSPTNAPVTFTLAAPNVLSGVQYYYSVGADWMPMGSNTLTVTENGTKTYRFKAVNLAGVESFESPSYPVQMDTSLDSIERKPSILVLPSGTIGDFTDKPVTFSLFSEGTKGDVTYYYNDGTGFKALAGNILTLNQDTNADYTFKVVDSTGRESSVTPAFNVKIDTDSPELLVTPSTTVFTNQDVQLQITVKGVAQDAIESVLMNGKDITAQNVVNVSENGTYHFVLTTVNGKTAAASVEIQNIDKAAPYVYDTAVSALAGKTELLVKYRDEGNAGVLRAEYQTVTADGVESAWKPFTGVSTDANGDTQFTPLVIDYDFSGSVFVRLTDNAGNSSEKVQVAENLVVEHTALSTVKVQATANGAPYAAESWSKQNVLLTFSANAYSGIAQYLVKCDDGAWMPSNGSYTVETAGRHTVYVKAVSNQGNESAVTSFKVNIDKESPVLKVNVQGTVNEWTTSDVQFSLSASALSDVTYYCTDGVSEIKLPDGVFTASEEGDRTYSFYAVNAAGEKSEVYTYNVKIDKAAPTLQFEQTETKPVNHAYAVSVKAEAGVSGVASVTVNNAPITDGKFIATQNGVYTVTVTANNGLTKTECVEITNIDTQKPIVTGIYFEKTNASAFKQFLHKLTFGNLFDSAIEISVDAFDYGLGIQTVEYRLLNENGEPVSDWTAYDAAHKPTIETEYKGFVEARATDVAENSSEVFTSAAVTVDTSAPTPVELKAKSNGKTYTPSAWTADSVTLELSSTAFSEIDHYAYRVDGGEWISLSGNSLTVDRSGDFLYSFKAVSKTNAESEVKTMHICIDKEAPVLTVERSGGENGFTAENVTFTLSASALSGVTYYYSDNGITYKKLEGSVLTLSENQEKNYTFKAVSGAGVKSEISAPQAVKIDKEAPQFTLEVSAQKPTNQPVKIQISGVKLGLSGIKSFTVNGTELESHKAFIAEQNGTYVFTLTANNGRSTTKSVTVSNIDTEAPREVQATFTDANGNASSDSVYSHQAILTLSAADAETMEYRFVNADGSVADFGIWHTYKAEKKPVIQKDFKGYAEVRATDAAGNVSEIFKSAAVTVETTAPKLKLRALAGDEAYKAGKWSAVPVTLSLEAKAFTDVQYFYKVADGDWQKLPENTMILENIGAYDYSFKAVSASGLESEIETISVCIDTEKPEALILEAKAGETNISSGATVSSDVCLSFSSKAASGIAKYQYQLNDGAWKDLDGNTLKTNGDGTYHYRFRAVSESGLFSEESEFTVNVETTPVTPPTEPQEPSTKPEPQEPTTKPDAQKPATKPSKPQSEPQSEPTTEPEAQTVDGPVIIPQTGGKIAVGALTFSLLLAGGAVAVLSKKKKNNNED